MICVPFIQTSFHDFILPRRRIRGLDLDQVARIAAQIKRDWACHHLAGWNVRRHLGRHIDLKKLPTTAHHQLVQRLLVRGEARDKEFRSKPPTPNQREKRNPHYEKP